MAGISKFGSFIRTNVVTNKGKAQVQQNERENQTGSTYSAKNRKPNRYDPLHGMSKNDYLHYYFLDVLKLENIEILSELIENEKIQIILKLTRFI